MATNLTPKKPIINCHTHIFTGDHVPPYLAKTFLPLGLYYLVPVSFIIKLFRYWYKYPDRWKYKTWYRNMKEFFYKFKMMIFRARKLRVASIILGTILTIHVFFILFDWLSILFPPNESFASKINTARGWLSKYYLLFIPASTFGKILFLLIVFIFVRTGRNFIWFILKKGWSFFGILPGPTSRALIARYINLGRFAFYNQQGRIFGKLRDQYPHGTGFVVLPMDMEYMGAGKLKKDFRYKSQMEALAAIKNKTEYTDIFFPFVFADPRRMAVEPDYLIYSIINNKVILEDCFVKTYIEEYKFNGFKIYPPLGYYPFDEALLPLWKYAADNGLPVLTHCIKGTIYYRGRKKKDWDRHPVFEQATGNDSYELMLMMETKNQDYVNNFTHPLNYLCLLEEKLLRKLVGKAQDNKIRTLFGYIDQDTPMAQDLRHLKLCFGHFGGDDEWDKFIELDRDNFSSQLVTNPDHGIFFLSDEDGDFRRGKPEQIWKSADWYTIICSLMLQYPNVYADLSYILHNTGIQPLLKQTLQNEKLKNKVLFGTDFYVVRNHKSEKNMLADMIDNLTEDEFDQIARNNPRDFLSSSIHGKVVI